MKVEEELNTLFDAFLSGSIDNSAKKKFKMSIDASHVEILLKKIESIGDPSDYCNDDETYAPVQEFFDFVDFISALIISLGEAGKLNLAKFRHSNRSYVTWVKKYVTDERFHLQCLKQLD